MQGPDPERREGRIQRTGIGLRPERGAYLKLIYPHLFEEQTVHPRTAEGQGLGGEAGRRVRGLQTGGTRPSLFPRATYDSRGGYRINYQFIFKMLL